MALGENGDRIDDPGVRVVGEDPDDLDLGIGRGIVVNTIANGTSPRATILTARSGFSARAILFSTLCQTARATRLTLPYRPAGWLSGSHIANGPAPFGQLVLEISRLRH
jgi:hypothetical protein